MTIIVECRKCGQTFTKTIDVKSLTEFETDSRSMGEEKHYRIPIIKCPRCNEPLEHIDIFEYPEGVYTAFAE